MRKCNIENELYTNKIPKIPKLFKQISPSEVIKHQSYKQILFAYMTGNQYIKCNLSLNIRPR